MNFKCNSNDALGPSYQSGYCLNSRFCCRFNNWSVWKEKRTETAILTHIWSRISASTFLPSFRHGGRLFDCHRTDSRCDYNWTCGHAGGRLSGRRLTTVPGLLLALLLGPAVPIGAPNASSERVADAIFIIAMTGMVIICGLITYNMSVPPR